MSSKTALVIVTNGSEEMEVVTPIDVLRRAGVEVTVAGLDSTSPVSLSRQVQIVPETSLTDAVSDNKAYDIIILPGGLKGAEAFLESETLGTALQNQEKEGRFIATICAAPNSLKRYGVFLGKKLTSYPTSEHKLKDAFEYSEERVVVDGKLISSRGPGTATEWSFTILKELLGEDKTREVGKSMLVQGY